MTNPYASPRDYPDEPTNDEDPLSSLRGPGIWLSLISIVSILQILAGQAVRAAAVAPTLDFFVQLALLFGVVLVQAFVLFSARQMLTGKNYGVCMAGAIIACIPMLTPLLVIGVPFGIWAVIVLRRPEVKAEFN